MPEASPFMISFFCKYIFTFQTNSAILFEKNVEKQTAAACKTGAVCYGAYRSTKARKGTNIP